MRISARGIVIQNGKLLTMYRRRIKDGEAREYYVIPGGGVEEGEQPIQTVVRELYEEMSVRVKVLDYLGKNELGDAYYFLCEIVGGKVCLGGEEKDKCCEDNFYKPTFINLEDLDKIDVIGKEFVEMAISKKL